MTENPPTFASVRRQFDFYSVEIGHWVSPAERDRAAGRFYQALCDLMQALDGPECLISLRGTLGLQYGTGGRPGVAAHYLPATRQLALAKNAGAGSLAHEWFHAFDHYMAAKALRPGHARPGDFISSAWLAQRPLRPHPLNTRLSQALARVLLCPNGEQPSQLVVASKAADRARGSVYYSRPEEMCARAFEAFIEDAMPASRFLVAGSRHSPDAKAGLYPHGQQRRGINAAFAAYFSRLGAALRRST